MNYSKLSKLLKPNVEELYYTEDCTQFFKDNVLPVPKDYRCNYYT